MALILVKWFVFLKCSWRIDKISQNGKLREQAENLRADPRIDNLNHQHQKEIGKFSKFYYFFKRFYLFIFREEAREKEREKNINWLPFAWVPNLQPRPPGIIQATICFAGPHQTH